MAGENAAKRRRLFDEFVRQPGHQDLTQGRYFFCPLCRRPFERDATVGDIPLLTLAHIIPESLGGTWTTLACAECNNGHGHAIEADFLTSHRITDWAAGRGVVDVRMGETRKVRAESVRIPEANNLSFKIITPMTNPAVREHKKHVEEITQNPANAKPFQFTIPWYRPNWCWAAVCQSAYLLMFSHFGYDFARHPSYELLSEQVRKPDERIWVGNIHVVDEREAAKLLQGNQAAVVFMRGALRAILAVMRFQSPGGANQVLSVMLPGLGEAMHAHQESMTFTPAVVPYEPEFMTTVQGFFWWRWNDWIRNYR